MSDFQSMKGEQVELRHKYQRQAATCEALRDKLRTLCRPTFTAGELEADAILDVAASLHTELADLKALDSKLTILNRELGS